MKPLEAAIDLKLARELIARGEPLPPSMRTWLCAAICQRLTDPSKSLDQRLSLASRSGGRLHGASTLPARDQAIRALSDGPGLPTHRAEALALRIRAHRREPDRVLTALEKALGRIPGTGRQLLKIIQRQTAASDSRYQRNLKSLDISAPAKAEQSGHEQKTS